MPFGKKRYSESGRRRACRSFLKKDLPVFAGAVPKEAEPVFFYEQKVKEIPRGVYFGPARRNRAFGLMILEILQFHRTD